MKKLFIFLVISAFSLLTNAQSIQSVDISPVSPTTNDVVTINVHYVFTSGPCDLFQQNVTIIGNSIYTEHFHCPGMLTVICTGTDNLQVGVLPPGNYSVFANLFTGTFDSLGVCFQFSQTDQMAFQFSVALGTGVEQLNSSKPILFIENDFLKISNLNGEYQFILYDVAGKIILSKIVTGYENSLALPVDAGIYFYALQNENAKVFTGKLIID